MSSIMFPDSDMGLGKTQRHCSNGRLSVHIPRNDSNSGVVN